MAVQYWSGSSVASAHFVNLYVFLLIYRVVSLYSCVLLYIHICSYLLQTLSTVTSSSTCSVASSSVVTMYGTGVAGSGATKKL